MTNVQLLLARRWLAAAIGLFVLIASLGSAVLQSPPAGSPDQARRRSDADDLSLMSERDAICIAEAYYLWQSLGDKVWPGWTKIDMPMVYITQEREFAIGFQQPLAGFSPHDPLADGQSVQSRPRELAPTLAASYDFQNVPAVVIGTPEALEWSASQWALKAVHEMFHVLSTHHGSQQRIAALDIGPREDASWQLDFPFPYGDADTMRLMHLQGYPVYLAITATDEADILYNAGTALEALAVLRRHLRDLTGDDRAWKYAMFQEGEEDVARYTEHRLAQLAAEEEAYRPLRAFAELDGFVPYSEVWNASYKSAPFVIKHAGRAVKTRTLFYYMGLGKALLLDRIKPDWRDSYLQGNAWLDELIEQSINPPPEASAPTAPPQSAPGR